MNSECITPWQEFFDAVYNKKKETKEEGEREREREKERMKYDSVRVISVAQLASGYFRSIFLFYWAFHGRWYIIVQKRRFQICSH